MSPGHVAAGDTAILPGLPNAAAGPAPSLLRIAASGAIDHHRLVAPTVVGRDLEADLAIDEPGISRRHARLTPRADGIEVVDLGSRNGTFVDGHPARATLARPGGLIRIGDALLLVVQFDEAWRAPERKGPLVGGPALAPVRRTVGLVGPTELPVLILGETGTGKDVVARLLHGASGRTGPFMAVNCAALPDHLVESELFGHARGAFTGADRERRGLLALTDGGTLFLDEIGELPLPAQAKLLRVLEDGVVRPVGGEKATKVQVRFVSATNRDLDRAVDEGRFRRDLYARLAAIELRLPPLRERREDLLGLIGFLLERGGHGPMPLASDALEALLLHGWPSNVRELDNVVRGLALRGGPVALADLPHHLQAQLRDARRIAEETRAAPPEHDLRARVVAALEHHRGNVRQASTTLGVARGHMYRLLKRLALEPGAYRERGTTVAEGEERGT
jgi:DNA-binding NtrC family response regulator